MSLDSRRSWQSFSTEDTGASNHSANVPLPGSPCHASVTSLGPAQVSGLEEPLMMLQETFRISCREMPQGKH